MIYTTRPMGNKQTALEWLVEQVNSDCLNSTFIRPELIDQAKEIEREHIEFAYHSGNRNAIDYCLEKKKLISASTYYEETYCNHVHQK